MRTKRLALLLLIFVTGLCTLVIELTAIRILAPHFGNTMYNVSGVLAVIMLGMSLGYVYGGRTADRGARELTIYWWLLLSGAFTALCAKCGDILLVPIAQSFPLTTGPLVGALALYVPPTILLSAIAPFTVKLLSQRFPEIGIGTISGEVSFCATVGCIAGSLLTGFVLIPFAGSVTSLWLAGLVLMLLAVGGLLRHGVRARAPLALALVCTLATAAFDAKSLYYPEGMVATFDGVYERIQIVDGKVSGRPARYFIQDRSPSGGMYLDDGSDLFDYTKHADVWSYLTPTTGNAAVLGAGIFTVPRRLAKYANVARVDTVDIEPNLEKVAIAYFGALDSRKVQFHVDDGRRFLVRSSGGYDLIFSDVYYSLLSVPFHLSTREFFETARARLSPTGLFVGNFIGRLDRAQPSYLHSAMRTFLEVFPDARFFAVSGPSLEDAQNVMFMGGPGLAALPHIPMLARLPGREISKARFRFQDHVALTDDYAPTDYFLRPLLGYLDSAPGALNGKSMLALVEQQVRNGSRALSSPQRAATQALIRGELSDAGLIVSEQRWDHAAIDGSKVRLTNIIGRLAPERHRRIALVTHYDSKKFADHDPQDPRAPMPGANDSASGTAVLLALARALAFEWRDFEVGVDFVFFDGEEGDENVDMAEWVPLGSTYFAQNISASYPTQPPELVIALDMVCDRNLTLHPEAASMEFAPRQTEALWKLGKKFAPDVFKDEVRSAIFDDHVPFGKLGIPAILVIDFDYPAYHTTADTPDQCSGRSLEIVANVVRRYVVSATKS